MKWSIREPSEFLRDSIQMARAVAPLDFPDELPIYARRFSELPDALRRSIASNCDGCTGAVFDLLLRPMLEECGEWRGPGLAFVVADQDWLDTLLVSMHELAHCIDLGYAKRVELARSADQQSAADGAELAGLIAAHYARHDAPYTQEQLDTMHGRRFVRAMGHLWHRVNAEHYAPPWFGCSTPADPGAVLDALASEAHEATAAGLSIGEALELPEPEPFAAMWDGPESPRENDNERGE